MLQITRNKSDGYDFYKTPKWVTKILCENETFDGNIWEPACGDGAICEALIDNGYLNISASDIKDYGYASASFNKDFLKETKKAVNIITNPPFTKNMPVKFMYKCEELATKKYVLLLPIRYMCGAYRVKFYSRVRAPKKIIPISRKIDFGGGAWYEFAWFIWDKDYNGQTQIVWKEIDVEQLCNSEL